MEFNSPEQAGLDSKKFTNGVESRNPGIGEAYSGPKIESNGVVLIRGGYILHLWG